MSINIEKISRYLAQESNRDPEVVLFGLRLLLTSICGYGALIFTSSLLGIVHYSLAAAITVSIFRVISGGAHASSQLRCNTIGVSMFLLLGFLAKEISEISGVLWVYIPIILAFTGLYITYVYVPAETPGKPIQSKAQRKYLKAISYLLFAIWGVVATLGLIVPLKFVTHKTIISSSLGLLWQMVTLTPVGYKIMEEMDSFLKNITLWKGGG